LSQRVRGRLILWSLSLGLLGVGARLVLKAAPLALLWIAVIQLGRADGQLLETHALAIPHGSLLAVVGSVAALALGLLVVLALSCGWHRPRRPRRERGS
jgi:hypothetical protein